MSPKEMPFATKPPRANHAYQPLPLSALSRASCAGCSAACSARWAELRICLVAIAPPEEVVAVGTVLTKVWVRAGTLARAFASDVTDPLKQGIFGYSLRPRLRSEGWRELRRLTSWSEDLREEHERDHKARVCLACGRELDKPPRSLGSLRCLECRSSGARLDQELVRRWHVRGAHLH
jgi:hypothetical protein